MTVVISLGFRFCFSLFSLLLERIPFVSVFPADSSISIHIMHAGFSERNRDLVRVSLEQTG